MDTNILAEIERFLADTGMAATTFGQRAIGDRHLVHELRHGRVRVGRSPTPRRIWPETAERIRAFMADHGAVASQAAA